jgi:quercetin dioxygenase-like cupin family protein
MHNQNLKPVIVPPEDGRTITVLGAEITVKLSSSDTKGDFYIFEGAVASGGGVPPHVHSREDEILEVLAGEFELVLGPDHFRLAEGGMAFFPRNVAHGFTNSGTTPAKYRITVSPGSNFEEFFEELSALPLDQSPDSDKVSEIFERFGLPIVNSQASE